VGALLEFRRMALNHFHRAGDAVLRADFSPGAAASALLRLAE